MPTIAELETVPPVFLSSERISERTDCDREQVDIESFIYMDQKTDILTDT